jgi:hypothetical protein
VALLESHQTKFPEAWKNTVIHGRHYIAYYVANSQRRGQSDLEKSQVLQWLGFPDSQIIIIFYRKIKVI